MLTDTYNQRWKRSGRRAMQNSTASMLWLEAVLWEQAASLTYLLTHSEPVSIYIKIITRRGVPVLSVVAHDI